MRLSPALAFNQPPEPPCLFDRRQVYTLQVLNQGRDLGIAAVLNGEDRLPAVEIRGAPAPFTCDEDVAAAPIGIASDEHGLQLPLLGHSDGERYDLPLGKDFAGLIGVWPDPVDRHLEGVPKSAILCHQRLARLLDRRHGCAEHWRGRLGSGHWLSRPARHEAPRLLERWAGCRLPRAPGQAAHRRLWS